MQSVTKLLSDILSDAFVSCGYDSSYGIVSLSDRPDLCQFQCNGAMSAAKAYKKAPFIIADEVVAALSTNENFSKIEVVKPGFINIDISDELLVSLVCEVSDDKNCGIPQTKKPDTIIIDYGGPNVAKPLHIGHLRPAIIGESIKRISKALGNNVYGDIHLGDWGLQIGLVIAELKVRNPEHICFSENFNPETDEIVDINSELLSEIYPFASGKSKIDEEFKATAKNITFELQSGDKNYTAIWKEIMRISIADMKVNYDKLGVFFDYWYGESDADKYIPSLMKKLNEKGLCYESDGALVVDVAEETDKAPIPPIIVKKSDNSSIYATTDLATIIQRRKDFLPDKIQYVVDKRQELHFTQVFRCARKADLVSPETSLAFYGFGTVNGADGKPYKTREGGLMPLSTLIETVTEASLNRLKSSEFVSAENLNDYAEKLGIAALKFGDLINHRSKDYIFDMDKFLSSEGKTGIYLLYTVSRINSIMRKVGDVSGEFSGVYTDSERELMLKMIMTGDVFVRASAESAPNIICENVYQLAVAFSQFYRENRIVDEADEAVKANRIAVARLCRKVMEKHLDVLGIETVENM